MKKAVLHECVLHVCGLIRTTDIILVVANYHSRYFEVAIVRNQTAEEL
jgi:hypothetical protein